MCMYLFAHTYKISQLLLCMYVLKDTYTYKHAGSLMETLGFDDGSGGCDDGSAE